MRRHAFRPHLCVLAIGYGLSVLATTGAIGHYQTYPGQPAAEALIVLYLLPVTATVICGLLWSLLRRRLPHQENGGTERAVRAILFWVISLLVIVHTLMIGVLLGITWIQPWATRGVVVAVGVVAMIIGNLLPRTRPNMAIGIRTARTLGDRSLWMRTHRMAGYTVVLLGAITVFAGLFLDRPRAAAVPGVSFLVSMVWLSGFYWKASHAAGSERA